MPKAKKESDSILLFDDGHILRIRVWEIAEPLPPSDHRFKYSCFYGRPAERVVLYDNERGKGDHRHIGDREEAYRLTTIDQLLDDFERDISNWSTP